MAIGTAAAIIGGGLLSGLFGSRSASSAADAQTDASNAAIEEQRRQFDLTRGDLSPYMQIGRQALGSLGSIYGYGIDQPEVQPATSNAFYGGVGPVLRTVDGVNYQPRRRFPTTAGTDRDLTGMPGQNPIPGTESQTLSGPNYSNFFASPDYEFRRSEGQRNIGNSFAARGGAFSGNALRALTDYNSNLAAGEFGNYFNRQAALAGIGQTAANTSGVFGGQAAGNIGNALIGAGNARASGIMGQGQALNNALQGGIGNWLLYRQLNQRQGGNQFYL